MIVINTYVTFIFLIPGLICLFIGAILFTFGITKTFSDSNSGNGEIAAAAFGIAIFFTGVIIIFASKTEYSQIIINDNVSISEVQEKYEIIDQKGISYIVKEIEPKGE